MGNEVELTNPVGRKMISWVAPIFGDSLVAKIIYQAQGMEWESVEVLIEEIKMQFFPQTAIWGLHWWEEGFGLPVNENQDITVRRNRVLAKIAESTIVNPKRMRTTAENITGIAITIFPNVAPYTFKIRCRSLSSSTEAALRAEISRIKPAHLSYIIEFIYNSWYDVRKFTWAQIAAMNWKQVKEDILDEQEF